MIGLRYVNDCFSSGDSSPGFVVKSSDEVFVETFHLFKFVAAIYGENPRRSLVCDVIPRGTGSQHHDVGTRDGDEVVPEHCRGMAYMITPDLAREFIAASEKVRALINLSRIFLHLAFFRFLHFKKTITFTLPEDFGSFSKLNLFT